MSALKSAIRLVPPNIRKAALDILVREYRLGWPKVLKSQPDRELDLLDLALARLSLGNKPIRFIQVGACDGVMGDPISPLVRRYSLEGVLIEPRPRLFERLKENYASMFSGGKFEFVNAAIADQDGEMQLWEAKAGLNAADWVEGTASFDKEVLLRGLRSFPDPESLINCVPVKAMTFDTLYRNHAIEPVDLLQVDAEGYDAKIIEMFDVPRRLPAIIRFEHTHLSNVEYDRTLAMLTASGYQVGLSANDTLALRV